MRRLIDIAGLLCTALLCCNALGCATRPPPRVLSIRVPNVDRATLTMIGIGGASGGSREECSVPCIVDIVPDAAYQLEVTAPGYYTARLRLQLSATYWMDQNAGTLTLPMVKKPARDPASVSTE